MVGDVFWKKAMSIDNNMDNIWFIKSMTFYFHTSKEISKTSGNGERMPPWSHLENIIAEII